MYNPKIKFEEYGHTKVTITGESYEETKKLGIRDLVLFVERDLNLYAKNNQEFIDSIEAILSPKAERHKRCLTIKVHVKNELYCEIIAPDLVRVLSNHNKQVMVSSKGRFQSAYNRFSYIIQFEQAQECAMEEAC